MTTYLPYRPSTTPYVTPYVTPSYVTPDIRPKTVSGIPVGSIIERPSETREYRSILAVMVLGMIVLGVAVYAFFPKIISPEAPVMEQAYQNVGDFPDFQIVSPGTQAINPWYLTPLEEETERIPYYPFHQRIYHNPANPLFT